MRGNIHGRPRKVPKVLRKHPQHARFSLPSGWLAGWLVTSYDITFVCMQVLNSFEARLAFHLCPLKLSCAPELGFHHHAFLNTCNRLCSALLHLCPDIYSLCRAKCSNGNTSSWQLYRRPSPSDPLLTPATLHERLVEFGSNGIGHPNDFSDPNGMFVDASGTWHLYYQCN